MPSAHVVRTVSLSPPAFWRPVEPHKRRNAQSSLFPVLRNRRMLCRPTVSPAHLYSFGLNQNSLVTAYHNTACPPAPSEHAYHRNDQTASPSGCAIDVHHVGFVLLRQRIASRDRLACGDCVAGERIHRPFILPAAKSRMLTYVITGANRGLGFGMARQLANEGNKVIGTARDLSAATDLAALPGVSVVQLDTTDPVSCKKAALEVSDLTGGTIDVLIANAGYNGTAAFFDLEEFPADDMLVSELELTYRTNVMGSILSINAFLPLLKKGQKKTVVAISSGMGDLKFQQDLEYSANAVYGASKAALSFVMGKYAIKHEHDGMIFFSLCPGWVDVTPDGKPSPYTEEALGPFVKMLQKVEPSCGGPKNLNDGAAACLTVIKGLTKEHSGQFLSYHGDKNWI